MRRSLAGLALDLAVDLAAVALLAVYLAAAVPAGLSHAFDMLGAAAEHRGETLTDSRIRTFGDAYVRAIDDIRADLPADQAYLLVAAEDARLADAYWVRYELAPRRAFFWGQLDDHTDADRLRRRIAVNARLVVVAHGGGQPPRLYARHDFLSEIERRRSGTAAAGAHERP